MHQHRFRRISVRPSWLAACLGLLGSGLVSAHAHAQADINPAAPDVMLLVDSSGSMDYKTSSNAFPACKYVGTSSTATVSERSRWTDLVEVLTGSIVNYDCQTLDRNSAQFRTEYSQTGPYDALYANPYHRPSSGGCVPGPGAWLPATPSAYPTGAIKYHRFDSNASTCNFDQALDGILDSNVNDIRFGLMTFDTEPNPAKDVTGLWSYYLNASKTGEPAGCNTPQAQEVGVRNTDAPPWEGRLVGFGNPATGSTDYKNRNAMIQEVLLSTRPYGATPIAGMLDDAAAYLLNDTSNDSIDSSFRIGRTNDPSTACRNTSIILLSDGQPNMDLRPFCEPNGCPYGKAEDIAQTLKAAGVEIYVIGFALSSVIVNGVSTSCSAFAATDFDSTNANGICRKNPGDQAIQACCSLNRIAAAGGHQGIGDADWTRARFADNRDELRAALSQALGTNNRTTTRTPFVNISSAGFFTERSDLTFARSVRFAASFSPGQVGAPWVGKLDRTRYICAPNASNVLTPQAAPVDPAKGDSFVDNVNYGGPDARKIFSVIGADTINSNASMRPNLPVGVDDGVGVYTGTMNTTAYTSSGFVSAIPPDALKVTDTTCDSSTQDLTKSQCRDRYLKWLVGLDNGTVFSRCKTAATCNLVADTLHSVPRAVAGRPAASLVDQSYQSFVTAEVTAKRPPMLYTSSNDGFLHAFKIMQVDKNDSTEAIQVKTKESNELWTFVPPGALPGIPATYPGAHQLLLDGTPAIKDVVATSDTSLPTYKFRLERTLAQARGGLGEWRTILVQSYGAQRPGYFAMDVTDPVLSGTNGPKFLWQLTTDATGTNPLFGNGGATPLITTVYLNGKEVAVAVLPGGYSNVPGTGGPSGQGCARAKTDYTDLAGIPKPRTSVPCYSGSAIQARSLTVVRLDSGEIIRTFRQAENEVPGLVGKQVWTQALLDSPMTGQPVAYPGGVGSVADRVFIGDQDGTLWRLNFASENGLPTDWKLEMFFDSFPNDGSTFSHAWNQGQPIISAPVVSVDQIGNLTVAHSTGDQEAVGAAPNLVNYVWSLTEVPSADRKTLSAKVNWHLDLSGSYSGDRVIGEMALFNGDLYFTTVGPASAACQSGNGKVWGMHYLTPHPEGAGKGGRPSPSLVGIANAAGYIDATTLLGSDAHAFLSGATVTQQPTCDTPDDPSSGVIGAASTGKFQLFIPTGDKVSTSTNARVTPVQQGGTNGAAIDLNPPPASLVVDSWASIVE